MEVQIHETLPLGRVGNYRSSHLWFGGLDFEGYQLFLSNILSNLGWFYGMNVMNFIGMLVSKSCAVMPHSWSICFFSVFVSLSLSLSLSLFLSFIDFKFQSSNQHDEKHDSYTLLYKNGNGKWTTNTRCSSYCKRLYLYIYVIYCIFSFPKGRYSNSSCSQPVF